MTCDVKNSGFDLNDTKRVACYESLCLQLVECLDQLEAWFIYYRNDNDGRNSVKYGRDIIKLQVFRQQLEDMKFFMRPQPSRIVHGLDVFDGGLR